MREHGPTPPPQKGDGRGVGERSKTNRTYPGVKSGKDGANGKEVVILTKGDHGVGAAPCSGGRGRVRCRSLGRWSTLEVLWVKPVGSGCCERKSLHNVGMASRSGARRPFMSSDDPSLLNLDTVHVGETISARRQTLERQSWDEYQDSWLRRRWHPGGSLDALVGGSVGIAKSRGCAEVSKSTRERGMDGDGELVAWEQPRVCLPYVT